jgi:hypothetical protein
MIPLAQYVLLRQIERDFGWKLMFSTASGRQRHKT